MNLRKIGSKKAQFQSFNVIYAIIIGFIAILFFAGWMYGQGLIYDALHQAGALNEQNYAPNTTWTNMTYAADATFGVLQDGIQSLRMVAAVYIFSLLISIIITNALIKVNPMYFFIYVLIAALGVVFSAPVSNAYQNLLTSGIYGGILPSFTMANWFMINLPTIVMFVTIIGGIFLFINLIRNQGERDLG